MPARATFVFVLSNPVLRHLYIGVAPDTAPPTSTERAQESMRDKLDELRRRPHPFMRGWMWREHRIKVLELLEAGSRAEAVELVRSVHRATEQMRRHLPLSHRLAQQGHLVYVHEHELR